MNAPTPMPSVRQATISDAETIARHRVRLFEDITPEDQRAEALELMGSSQSALRTMLADGTSVAWVTDEDVPLGSLVMHLVRRLPSVKSPNGLEGYLVHLYVEEAARGTGRGAALVVAAEAEARRRGLSRIRLHTAVDSLEFYERAGFMLRTLDMEKLLG